MKRTIKSETPYLETLGSLYLLELTQRFHKKIVISETGCWEWQKAKHEGYGVFATCNNGKARNILAHRFAFWVYSGKIPDDSMVLHKCDNRSCCNPKHLFLGTHSDNMRDAMSKGRMVIPRFIGETHPQATITFEIACQIHFLNSRGLRRGEIARELSTSGDIVGQVVKERTWKGSKQSFHTLQTENQIHSKCS